MTSTLEISANLLVALSIFLAGRNSLHTWWLGMMGCTLFGVLFYQANLYADALLQVFFVVTSAIGWWHWQSGTQRKAKPITRTDRRTLFAALPFGVLVACGYGWMLHRFTDAYAPFADSGVLVFSVIAQILLMLRRLECWWYWLLVNTIAVPLFASRELYVTAALYVCFWVNALVAYHYWKGQMRISQPLLAAEH